MANDEVVKAAVIGERPPAASCRNQPALGNSFDKEVSGEQRRRLVGLGSTDGRGWGGGWPRAEVGSLTMSDREYFTFTAANHKWTAWHSIGAACTHAECPSFAVFLACW